MYLVGFMWFNIALPLRYMSRRRMSNVHWQLFLVPLAGSFTSTTDTKYNTVKCICFLLIMFVYKASWCQSLAETNYFSESVTWLNSFYRNNMYHINYTNSRGKPSGYQESSPARRDQTVNYKCVYSLG